MIERETEHLTRLIARYPALDACRKQIVQGYKLLVTCYEHGGKLLIAGNGGSAADAEHIAGELMKRFRLPRPVDQAFAKRLTEVDRERGAHLAAHLERGLMAIPLVAHEALITAYINDSDGLCVFAQQLYGFGRNGDVFLAISTSGNSPNILYAAVTAKAMGIAVLGLTGQSGGRLAELADVAVRVPERETYLIQELHLPIYHGWCSMLEERFFGGSQWGGSDAPAGENADSL